MKSHFIHALITLALCGVTLVGYGFWYTAVANKSTAVASIQNQIDAKTEYAPYNLSIAKLSVGKDEKDIWHANIELLVGSVPASSVATSTRAVPPDIISSSFTTHAYF